jgi:hypothetical protein
MLENGLSLETVLTHLFRTGPGMATMYVVVCSG